MKACTHCNKIKELYEFPMISHTNRYQSWCRKCTNVAAAECRHRRLRLHRDRINEIKQERGCIDCGSREQLEFDHIDPATKTANVSRLRCFNWKTIQAEIDKCEVRCRPCHVARTTELGQWNHG